METWKDIKGYEGLYQVSDAGNVRSCDHVVKNRSGMALKKGKILAQANVDKTHYKKVTLYRNNVGKTFLVHRLVAMAFIDNPEGYEQINHIDENPSNNAMSNLEWCDAKYNVTYGSRTEKSIKKRTGTPVGEQAILQYSLTGELIQRFESAVKAAKAIGGDNSSICRCANGKNKTSYGYYWKWATDG